MLSHSNKMDCSSLEFRSQLVVKPVLISSDTIFKKISFQSIKSPESLMQKIILCESVVSTIGFSDVKERFRHGHISEHGATVFRLVVSERDSEETISEIGNERVGGTNKHEQTEIELLTVEKKGIPNSVLNDIIILLNC
jgi:hypothetical protein